MDLESELRKAMAEEVAEAAAPPSLAADVRRRHRRRVARIRTGIGVVAAAVVAVALVPTYQSFRTVPAGSNGKQAPSSGIPSTRQPERHPASGLPSSPPPQGRSEAGSSPKPTVVPSQGSGGHPARSGSPGVVPTLPRWVTYLPDGLTAPEPCAVKGDAQRKTTTCKWRGGSGWVEVAVIRGSGVTGPQDLSPAPGVPQHTSVRGIPAFTTDRSDSSRQVSWLARPGVGVVVTAAGTAKDKLMRIAEGVRP